MPTNASVDPKVLPDQALLSHVKGLVARERAVTTELIICLAEVDERHLYLGLGYPSLFAYCTEGLHLSEHAAYGRIQAARCSQRFPQILDKLNDGSLTLTAITLLARVMTARNVDLLLAGATHKSKREIEHLVAVVRPQPPCATIVRKTPVLPQRPTADGAQRSTTGPSPAATELPADLQTASASSAEPAPLVLAASSAANPEPIVISAATATSLGHSAQAGSIHPLSEETYRVQFTLSKAGHKNFRRVQDLLRHRLPSGDPGAIFERALAMLVIQLEKKKHGGRDAARTARAVTSLLSRPPAFTLRRSRHIPRGIRKSVWKRDGGRCAFVSASGRRCRETGFLEFHHVVPFADGGETSTANLQLRCWAHNRHEIAMWAPEDSRQPERSSLAALGPDRVASTTLNSSKPPP
jgi:hypothetical protein